MTSSGIASDKQLRLPLASPEDEVRSGLRREDAPVCLPNLLERALERSNIPPLPQAADLAGHVGLEIAHEVRHALSVRNSDQEVIVVRGHKESRDLDRVKPLGAAEDAQHDFIQSWIGPEKIPAVDRAAGDVDESAFFWDEADWS